MSNKNKWNADAEMSMMGFVIPVESEEHLKHLIGYTLLTLDPNYSKERVDEVFNNALHKYNSGKNPSIQYMVCNDSYCGRMITFVRDKAKLTKADGSCTANGNLAWVENIDYPDCSELGYVYFQSKNGKVRRVG